MKIILFDIDGTLVNTDASGKDAMVASFLAVAGLEAITQPIEVSGKTDRGIAHELFSVHGQTMTDAKWDAFLAGYLAGLKANLPQRNGRVLAGISELLSILDEREDVTLGLLTGNVVQGANLKLTHFEIMHYFPFGGFGDEHPNRDDVARMAHQKAEQHLGTFIAGNQVYVIGDTANDVTCARAIGASAIAVATGKYSSETLAESNPDLLVEDLSDPVPLLSLLDS
ncbi:MAG: hypothetical protein COA78_32345 [Blastopirellula sp.]|nr:MAG: hypothetical protein COA78_32345 [Blastopirellula sp.]